MRETIKISNAQSLAETTHQDAVDAKLTSRALLWSSHVLQLDDVISVPSLDFYMLLPYIDGFFPHDRE